MTGRVDDWFNAHWPPVNSGCGHYLPPPVMPRAWWRWLTSASFRADVRRTALRLQEASERARQTREELNVEERAQGLPVDGGPHYPADLRRRG